MHCPLQEKWKESLYRLEELCITVLGAQAEGGLETCLLNLLCISCLGMDITLAVLNVWCKEAS